METAKLPVKFTVAACMTAKRERDCLFNAPSNSQLNVNF